MNTIIKSLRDALKQIFLTKFIFGSIGSVLSFFYLPEKIFGCDKSDSWKYALIGLSVWYIFVFFYKLWQNYKVWFASHFFDNKWGEGIILIKIVSDEKEKVKMGILAPHRAIKKICNELKKFYERKSSKLYSVSIKVPRDLDVNLDEMIVENICRDDASDKVRNTKAYNEQIHRLFGNTAYTSIVSKMYNKKHKAYYLNNHVDQDSNYDTTSAEAYSCGLPYKSEFVFPLTMHPVENTNGPSEICGFLCVDCSDEDGFQDDKYSVNMVKCIASNITKIINSINDNGKPEDNLEHS